MSDEHDAPQIRFKGTELAPGLHMLEGIGGFAGGNLGLSVGEDGVVLIDDSMAPFSGPMLEAIAKVTDQPVDYVINTHVHGDHFGGNEIMAGEGATIVAHHNLRQRMVDQGMPTPDGNVPTPKAALPVVTFSEELHFHLNGTTIQVFHVADAHTDGDAVIHYPELNVIHTGDVMFNGLFPYIDLNNGGSVDGFIAAQEAILGMANDETKIIPGHGPLASKADLEASVAMLKTGRERVKALIAEGKSEDEIVEANPLEEFTDDWNWGFITTERMTRTLAQDLR